MSTTENDRKRASTFREAVNGLAGTVRGQYFTYLLLGTYIGVTIASTTDEQLLRISPVTLPILDIELPIIAFYAVVPWLLALAHVYLLLQLYRLAKRVHLFNDALEAVHGEAEREEQRTLLVPFPFVHMLAGERSRLLGVVNATIVWVTIVWLPFGLVLSAQVRFLPYHDSFVTLSARIAIAVELVALWTFWPLVLGRDAVSMRRWWRNGLRAPVVWFRRAARQTGRATGFGTMTASTALVLGFSWLVAVLPGEPMERWVAFWLPVPEETRTGASGTSGNLLTYRVFDGPSAPLHRNLQLAGRLLIASDIEPRERRALRLLRSPERPGILDNIEGVNLSGRDLRYANLYGAVLVNADLRGASLDGADLRGADLEGVDMRPLEVSPGTACVDGSQKRAAERPVAGVDFVSKQPFYCATSARDARFRDAHLVGVPAQLALLLRADFRSAELARMNMDGADLREARLSRAGVGGTTFGTADLRGIRISVASANPVRLRAEQPDLTGAWVSNMDLDGLTIRSAAFSRFSRVSLRMADLSNGDFRGAVFGGGTDLRGANLAGADLRGAEFDAADLRGADLRGVKADLARFSRAGVCMADLSGASLRGAEWSNSSVDGSSLASVDLRYARIHQVNARGADLRRAALRPFEMYGLVLNYADLRELEDRTDDDVETLRETAAVLRASEWEPSSWQEGTLAALASGQLTTADPHDRGAVANHPLLCDETSAALRGNLERFCVDGEQRLNYLREALPEACEDPNVMSGLIRQSGLPVGARSNRRGPFLDPGPERDYFVALVSGTGHCPDTVDRMDARARELLGEIRVTIENGSPLRSSLPVQVVDAPCER